MACVTLSGQRQDLNFIGQQIAGFNVAEAPPVPEPGSWALLLGGLAALGGRLRRQRRAA